MNLPVLIVMTGAFLVLQGRFGGTAQENHDGFSQAVPEGSRWTPELEARIRRIAGNVRWEDRPFTPLLTAETLEASIRKGHAYLLNSQTREGNFHYEYDFLRKMLSRSDNEVRQAGALWGLALLHMDSPTSRSRTALDKGIDFFVQRSRRAERGGLVPIYPRSGRTGTGAVALVSLAIIEYLRGDLSLPEDRRAVLSKSLRGYLDFLKAQQFPDGSFSAAYLHARGKRSIQRSCYSDGEALLAFCKAARYLGHVDLLPRIDAASAVMIQRYVLDALGVEPDPIETKQFYQWGTMSFWECYDAGWRHGASCADTAMLMAWWMIHKHKTLSRSRNTAYAHEGLVHAYRIAKTKRNSPAAAELRYVIDRGLHKLMTWQVDGPLAEENSFLRLNPTQDPFAIGGFMNSRDDPVLRIDVTQHQLHAMQLALRHVYRQEPGEVQEAPE